MSEREKVGIPWAFMFPNMSNAPRLQMTMLHEAQKQVAVWMKRRFDAMEATSRSFQAMLGCKDVGHMAAAYGEWLAGSMNLLIADMNDGRDAALRMVNFGQNAMAAVRYQRTEAKVPSTTAPHTAGAKEAPRVKGAPSQATHEMGEQRAAE